MTRKLIESEVEELLTHQIPNPTYGRGGVKQTISVKYAISQPKGSELYNAAKAYILSNTSRPEDKKEKDSKKAGKTDGTRKTSAKQEKKANVHHALIDKQLGYDNELKESVKKAAKALGTSSGKVVDILKTFSEIIGNTSDNGAYVFTDDFGPTIMSVAGDDGSLITRYFDPDDRSVEHAHFKISPEKRGGGHAVNMFNKSLPLYDDLGMQTITAHTGLEAGPIVWALMKIQVDDPSIVTDQINRNLSFGSLKELAVAGVANAESPKQMQVMEDAIVFIDDPNNQDDIDDFISKFQNISDTLENDQNPYTEQLTRDYITDVLVQHELGPVLMQGVSYGGHWDIRPGSKKRKEFERYLSIKSRQGKKQNEQ